MPDRIADPWGERTPYARGDAWPVRVDVHSPTDSTSAGGSLGAVGVGAALQRRRAGHRRRGRPDRRRARSRPRDRVNRGRLDPKDLFGWQANHAPDRLTRPLVRDGGELVETDWDTAMGRIVDALAGSCSTSRAAGGASASTPAASCSSRSTTRSP